MVLAHEVHDQGVLAPVEHGSESAASILRDAVGVSRLPASALAFLTCRAPACWTLQLGAVAEGQTVTVKGPNVKAQTERRDAEGSAHSHGRADRGCRHEQGLGKSFLVSNCPKAGTRVSSLPGRTGGILRRIRCRPQRNLARKGWCLDDAL